MTNERLQELIYKFNILTDENSNAYILPTKRGYKFSPLKKDDIEKCIAITKDELAGLLDRTLIFNPTTQKCEQAPIRYSAERKRVRELKKLLADTDYKAIKYAEGVLSEEEYAVVKEQRIAWRKEINELEAIING